MLLLMLLSQQARWVQVRERDERSPMKRSECNRIVLSKSCPHSNKKNYAIAQNGAKRKELRRVRGDAESNRRTKVCRFEHGSFCNSGHFVSQIMFLPPRRVLVRFWALKPQTLRSLGNTFCPP